MNLKPRTLLEIAGASLAPGRLDRSVLVLIDAQLEYTIGSLPLTGIEAAIGEARRLLDLARASQVPVFHIVHHGRPGSAAFDPDGPFAAIVPELAPADGETVIVKALPNAFAGTKLHDMIAATRRKELIVAGFATHMCISATVRAALDLGYRSTIVASATATRDLPHPLARSIVPARAVHDAALAALADRFAIVVPDAVALIEAHRCEAGRCV